ncbi:MAG: hypothetical protein KatS3mg087_0626 [Patescibacteria group bacterium]|jgi:hypothetical protein|nr:MAG: hypothetical protein KatS3mg087_0626 [Patescibacteria group bacterium]
MFALPPIKKFQWGVWDCFQLCCSVRSLNGLEPFSDDVLNEIDLIYQKYNENNFDSSAIALLLEQFTIKVEAPQDFDLVLIRNEKQEYCLGTVLDNLVWFMGANTRFKSIYRINVLSYWRYKNGCDRVCRCKR